MLLQRNEQQSISVAAEVILTPRSSRTLTLRLEHTSRDCNQAKLIPAGGTWQRHRKVRFLEIYRLGPMYQLSYKVLPKLIWLICTSADAHALLSSKLRRAPHPSYSSKHALTHMKIEQDREHTQ